MRRGDSILLLTAREVWEKAVQYLVKNSWDSGNSAFAFKTQKTI